MNLEGKTALITGASSGIGRTMALTFAEAGADIIINYIGPAQDAEEVADKVRAMGRRALVLETDVSDTEAVAAMVEKAAKEMGHIDILVNNAGITRDGLLLRMKESDWDAVLAINLKGVFNCTKAVLKYMMKQRYGRIISISSVVGVNGNAGQANYAAAKAGIIGFTKSVAKEAASRGITANAIAPGFVKTNMTAVLPEKTVAAMLASIPLGRLGETEDIAKAALFLAGDAASYITGQVLHVDGGMVM